MFKLVLILLLITAVMLGDIIWDFILDGIWWSGLWLRAKELNFDKRRRPKRHHYKYY